MYLLDNIKIGDTVIVSYKPMPYLGTGIVESISVEGVVSNIREFKGVTYISIADAEGNVILERNLRDIENIEKVEIVEAQPEQKVVQAPPTSRYNRG